MKKKISIVTLLTAILLSLAAGSASAQYGYGDTFESPMEIWNPYTSSTNTVILPIDSPNDNDWYVVNNASGSKYINFSVAVTPPSGIDLTLQLVRTDSNNNITGTSYINYNGKGEVEAVGTDVQAGKKVYIRVISTGRDDYDPNRPYTLQFTKF
ncbi:hypothetical protein J2Z69_000312 [Paenibacillus shirakamiensis]|uniref:Uncharacterized protein n=1 Tax=Paenibacillus shirakamiensis TaxID=1265935 RepID=A0ABS4JC38_9BACL|nr:hypothetical protein [Paenibacillus shirakamiensis]MBP1999293.1 hypothetical protein [Paenibacillus shirakamiensis]